jgi:hypothetical protein
MGLRREENPFAFGKFGAGADPEGLRQPAAYSSQRRR